MEPSLIDKLLGFRHSLFESDLGEGVEMPYWFKA